EIRDDPEPAAARFALAAGYPHSRLRRDTVARFDAVCLQFLLAVRNAAGRGLKTRATRGDGTVRSMTAVARSVTAIVCSLTTTVRSVTAIVGPETVLSGSDTAGTSLVTVDASSMTACASLV